MIRKLFVRYNHPSMKPGTAPIFDPITISSVSKPGIQPNGALPPPNMLIVVLGTAQTAFEFAGNPSQFMGVLLGIVKAYNARVAAPDYSGGFEIVEFYGSDSPPPPPKPEEPKSQIIAG